LDFEDDYDSDLADLAARPGSWANYVRGVAWALQQAGYATHGRALALVRDAQAQDFVNRVTGG
jgi:galactokinase